LHVGLRASALLSPPSTAATTGPALRSSELDSAHRRNWLVPLYPAVTFLGSLRGPPPPMPSVHFSVSARKCHLRRVNNRPTETPPGAGPQATGICAAFAQRPSRRLGCDHWRFWKKLDKPPVRAMDTSDNGPVPNQGSAAIVLQVQSRAFIRAALARSHCQVLLGRTSPMGALSRAISEP